MILKNLQNQIIKNVKVHVENSKIFNFEGLEFRHYDNGIFKFLSFEKEMKIKTMIKFDPYNGQVSAVFEDNRETSWLIGEITELQN
ncbi:hypothetical protein CEQ21_07725 (plasmid) [Niallia circulans]|uniref:Uncharacterized protein n=1 Tax=Niallia circulans TaxID=1397 RepID=A0A553SQI8_NIACI|nr:hypothetical protein [Niallia circulans]TRZ39248.1 hypothetical protein CEQ21_07725 [Niallia circulans]